MKVYNGLCNCRSYVVASHQIHNVKRQMESHVAECGGMGRITDENGTIRYVAPPFKGERSKIETTYIRHYSNLNLTTVTTYAK